MNKPTQVTTGEVRISYEHLLKPYAQQQGAEPKFSATLLIPKSDIGTKQRIDAAIQAAIAEGVAGKWNGARPPQPPVPVYDGDGLRPNGEMFGEECKGHWVMTANSKQQQEIVDMQMNPIFDSTQVYSGMYARVVINFFAYNAAGKKGIGCGLGPVQKTRDGEPLGGRMSAAEAFGGGSDSASYPAQPQQYQAAPQQAPAGYPAQPQQQYQAAPQQAPGNQFYPQSTQYTNYPQQAPQQTPPPASGFGVDDYPFA